MPIHSHHCAERLKPEGVGKTAQQFVPAIAPGLDARVEP
jgi:hypothetical protein